MHRGTRIRNWPRGAVFTGSSLVAGVSVGAAAGLLGSTIPVDVRTGLASVFAAALVVVGIFELMPRGLRPLECRRETPKDWVYRGKPMRWAVQNGLALGCGALSRLGFCLWYVVPLACLFSGSVLLGAAIYGAYGVARGFFVWPLIFVAHATELDLGEWLIARSTTAKRIAAVELITVCTAIAVGVGL